VREKYGSNRVANIITYGTIKAKSAVRDVGRVMGIPLSEVNAIAKLVPADPKATLFKALNEVNEIKEFGRDPKIKKMFDIALKLEGLRRQTGVHAAGVVISKEDVTNYVPLANQNNKGVITTQYDGNVLGTLGMLKVDFLGLRTLTIIETASEFIRKLPGKENFDIYSVPMDDKKTFDLLCEGKTTGVFQLESEGMKKLVKGLKPTVFSDISALVALYRPGPIESGMLETFVERKHGRKKITYDHRLLEPILKDTYGTMVYQEQVMEIAKSMAKFTPSEADDFRKAMGKKKLDVMEKMRDKFVKQAKDAAVFTFNWLSAPGTGIFLAALISGLVLGMTGDMWGQAIRRTASRMKYPLLTIGLVLGMGYVTKYSGMDAVMGLAFTRTGVLYPFFAAMLGWLGVALTGSDTSSNVMFGSMQKITAEQLHLSPVLIVTANSTGGVMGKMIDAQSIVVATAACYEDKEEGKLAAGPIFRGVLPHSLLLAALMGVLVMLQAYVLPWMIPGN